MGDYTQPRAPKILDQAEIVEIDTGLGRVTVECEQSGTTRDRSNDLKTAILKLRGIKYAEIMYRWAAPRATGPWRGLQTCTEFGPGCPQISRPLFDISGIPLFGRVGAKTIPIKPERVDEFGCLNLNIWAPVTIKGDLDRVVMKKKLPVLVWVHGGSYMVGAGGVNLYDGTELIRRSIELNTPIVFVTFNYRVGILGHLHSRKLAEEASMQTDVPPRFRSTANLGLLDAHMAFDWVKKHIHHFGGDPNNVSGIGESAGAGILNYLTLIPGLHLKIPRIILSSSTCFSVQLLRSQEAELWYDRVCEKLKIAPNAPDVLSQLREVHVEDLVTKSSFALSAFRPVWDNVTITLDPREVIRNSSLWDDSLEQLVMGVCRNEPWIRQACEPHQTGRLEMVVNGRIPPIRDLREKALRYYGSGQIDFDWFEPSARLHIHGKELLAFDGHARYYTPAKQVCESLLSSAARSGKQRVVYRYICSWATSHWSKEWPVTHTADILPTFLHSSLTPKEKVIAHTLVDQLIAFVSSTPEKITWRSYTAGDRALNELTEHGQWNVLMEDQNAFSLTQESSKLWDDIVTAILDTGADGWADMAR